jgi:hypothetical protein
MELFYNEKKCGVCYLKENPSFARALLISLLSLYFSLKAYEGNVIEHY